MKTRLTSLLAVFCLLLALTPPAPAAGRHPEIEDALHALDRAKDHLQHAAHDFGGHRVDAIRAIEEAKHQLEICLQY